MTISEIGRAAKAACRNLSSLSQNAKNQGLLFAADALIQHTDRILAANDEDLRRAREKGMKESLIDRLALNPARIEGMSEGLRQIASLPDPIGETIASSLRPNGLEVVEKRVPLGVVGIIYESRPNVTADAFGLCHKTGNAVILKGGSDAITTNTVIVDILQDALCDAAAERGDADAASWIRDSILLIKDTNRQAAMDLMRLNAYVDVLIPRGGAGLIRSVVENSTVPIIETGTGNCHIFVDESADIDMAVDIIENAKTQRTGVCNACESLVIHSAAADRALPPIAARLLAHGVEMRGDARACALVPEMIPATEEDWGTEYLDKIISVRILDSIDEAIRHINTYNTGHSEAIITRDYANARLFLDRVDAAAVYVNASTRFTDGFEFGFGAEIGISTQKLHARGPMGLKALTTSKYVIYGSGQVRP